MPFLDKLKKIDSYLKKIEQLNRDLERSGEINRLQTDLVREYLRDLYELYAEMSSADAEVVSTEIPEKAAPILPKDPVKPEVSNVEFLDDVIQEVEAPQETEIPSEQAPVEEASNGSLFQDVTDEEGPVSLLEKFQKESKGTEVNRQQVTGKMLGQLIPLNDKIMFNREFFDNNIARYEIAIAELDKLSSKTEVLEYMQKNAWSDYIMENQREVIDRFVSIIDLKYSEE